MERLTGLDAAFLAMETPTQHLHVAAVMVFELPDTSARSHRYRSSPRAAYFSEPRALHITRLRQLVEDRLHLVPPFRQRHCSHLSI